MGRGFEEPLGMPAHTLECLHRMPPQLSANTHLGRQWVMALVTHAGALGGVPGSRLWPDTWDRGPVRCELQVDGPRCVCLLG